MSEVAFTPEEMAHLQGIESLRIQLGFAQAEKNDEAQKIADQIAEIAKERTMAFRQYQSAVGAIAVSRIPSGKQWELKKDKTGLIVHD